jgi:hypothetical protein
VISERETTNGGYTDLEMYIRPNNLRKHTQFIFEIKYIKKENEKDFESIKENAKNQLVGYLANDLFLQNKYDLRAFVVIFMKDTLFWEQVNQ